MRVGTLTVIGAGLLGTVGLTVLGGSGPVQAAVAGPTTASTNADLTAWPALIQTALGWVNTHAPSTAPLEGPAWLPTYMSHMTLSTQADYKSPASRGGEASYMYQLFETVKALPVNSPQLGRSKRDPSPLLAITVVSPWHPATAAQMAAKNSLWSSPKGAGIAVGLGHGIVGLRYSRGQQGQTSFGEPIIVWHEDDWTLEVAGAASQVLSEAKTEVTLANQMLLPPHVGVGVVVVSAKGPYTRFVWQQNATQVSLAIKTAMPANIRDTIRMAATWQISSTKSPLSAALAARMKNIAGIADPSAFVQGFKRLQMDVAQGNQAKVAAFVAYPLHVYTGGKKQTIANAQAFVQHYNAIMTTKVKAAIAAQQVNQLFVNSEGVMVGNGEVWLTQFVHTTCSIITINH